MLLRLQRCGSPFAQAENDVDDLYLPYKPKRRTKATIAREKGLEPLVDETGKLLAHDVLYLHASKQGNAEAAPKLEGLLRKCHVRAIAIGNGTASRETDAFVREFLREKGIDGIFSVTVSEAGASVYSASDIARQEFPDLDLTVRGAISMARRLQDPLSELVKVDPKSIGGGAVST